MRWQKITKPKILPHIKHWHGLYVLFFPPNFPIGFRFFLFGLNYKGKIKEDFQIVHRLWKGGVFIVILDRVCRSGKPVFLSKLKHMKRPLPNWVSAIFYFTLERYCSLKTSQKGREGNESCCCSGCLCWTSWLAFNCLWAFH